MNPTEPFDQLSARQIPVLTIAQAEGEGLAVVTGDPHHPAGGETLRS